MSPYIS